MRCVTLPGGDVVPSMGQGTWKMGERAERRSDEIAALRAGVDLGMTLIDTELPRVLWRRFLSDLSG